MKQVWSLSCQSENIWSRILMLSSGNFYVVHTLFSVMRNCAKNGNNHHLLRADCGQWVA